MEGVVSWNIRGLKNTRNKNYTKKVNKIKTELEEVGQLKILCLQETHLQSENEIPQAWQEYKHLYHILSTNANEDDKYAGILLFINKTEDVLICDSLMEGRILYAKIENKVTKEEKNIFAFYGISGNKAKNKQGVELLKIIKNKVEQESLKNHCFLGDFNFVTSALDRNSNSLNRIE